MLFIGNYGKKRMKTKMTNYDAEIQSIGERVFIVTEVAFDIFTYYKKEMEPAQRIAITEKVSHIVTRRISERENGATSNFTKLAFFLDALKLSETVFLTTYGLANEKTQATLANNVRVCQNGIQYISEIASKMEE